MTVNECQKLDLRWMLRNGYFKRDRFYSGSLEWDYGSLKRYESLISDNEKYLRLMYCMNRNGVAVEYDYKIRIEAVPSNLGVGEILYFICPESNKRARVLYLANGHDKFIHRDCYLEKYGKRLYYTSQKSSKGDYHNSMYFTLKRLVDALESQIIGVKHRKRVYNGIPTKKVQRLDQLKAKMEFHNRKRISSLSQFLRGKQG